MITRPLLLSLALFPATATQAADPTTTPPPPATTPATTTTNTTTTTTTTRPLAMPEGKPWKILMPPKKLQITLLVPNKWERSEPTETSPPMIVQRASIKDTFRATWYYAILDARKDKPQRVLDRAIIGRTEKTKNFEIREQKTFTLPDGRDAATLLYIGRDAKGTQFVARETYSWVDDQHLLITFEWAVRDAWAPLRRDLEAMTAAVKVEPYTPPPTQPAKTPATNP